MNKTFKYIIYSTLLLSLGASCGQADKVEEKTEAKAAPVDSSAATTSVHLDEKQIQNAEISVGNPAYEDISGVISLQGLVASTPENSVSLSFPIGGYIKTANVLPGKPVSKGQVLATIEDLSIIQLQQDYLTAKTNRDLAETEFARQKDLNLTKATSDKVFQQAKATFDRERILVSALAGKLQLIGIDPTELTPLNVKKSVSVKAPISGFVSRVNVSVGKYTAPTDVLFEITDPTNVYLSLKVFEKDLSKIEIGGQVTAYATGDMEHKYPAKVFLINKNFDSNRMADVLCRFEKTDETIVPGMFMNGDVNIDKLKSLVVPEEAVVRWQNKYYVFEEESKGTFAMREVQVGVQKQGKQQIATDLITKDSQIVLKNAFTLLMKLQNSEAS